MRGWRPASACVPARASCCWTGLGFADDRPVSLTSHFFPAARLPGLLDALRAAPRITEALQAVGVSDYMRQLTRVTARLPTRRRPTCCAPAAAGRCWWRRTSMSIAPARWWNSPSGLYPTPRVQIVFEP